MHISHASFFGSKTLLYCSTVLLISLHSISSFHMYMIRGQTRKDKEQHNQLTQLNTFYFRSRLKNLPLFHGDDLSYLKQINDNVFVEGVPEVHPVPLEALCMNTVDYILVSNWHSVVALPFYTENSGFKGVVYSTEPVVHFGRLMMQELIEYHEKIVSEHVDSKWKDPSIYCTFPNAPVRNPSEWKQFYSKKTMDDALSRITTVSFNQPI
ncbi:hypothetical protein NECAME_02004, partial [Necator americanus]